MYLAKSEHKPNIGTTGLEETSFICARCKATEICLDATGGLFWVNIRNYFPFCKKDMDN